MIFWFFCTSFCIHLSSFKLKQRDHFQSSCFETVSHLQVSRTLFSDVNHCSKLLSVIFSLLPFLKLQLALHAISYTHAILLPSGGISISSSNHLSNSFSWLFCTKSSLTNKIFYQNLLCCSTLPRYQSLFLCISLVQERLYTLKHLLRPHRLLTKTASVTLKWMNWMDYFHL